ncbi:MAG: hypothetical protein EOM59_12935 [Clostridia bacterium]|nr:hypothetical protein [Clostridia bacterium]
MIFPQVIDESLDNVVSESGDYVRSLGGVAFIGYMDEVRISKGIARWTANFDVPTIPHTVEDAGVITVSPACSRISVGLPYTCDFETLNVEVGLRDGTMQGRQVKISNVVFRLINTKGGWIGPDEEHLYNAMTDDSLELTDSYALFSGDVPLALGAGYEDGGRIFYRQVDPLPITISAVIPDVSVY